MVQSSIEGKKGSESTMTSALSNANEVAVKINGGNKEDKKK